MTAEMSAGEMRFVSCREPGGPEVLEIARQASPTPKRGEVLIQVICAGINRPDLMGRAGKYPPPPGASPILGLEVAGIVKACDADSHFKVGDAVCALTPGGGYAEYVVAPEPQCLPVPKGLSMQEAAGIPETFFTVWSNVFRIAQFKRGESFLVHGGTSGIGTTALQLARAFGARAFATAGSAAKCRACLELGAEAAFNYREQDFVAEIKKATGDRGVDVILDMVGGSYTPRNLQSLAPRGRLVQIATQQGAEATVNLLAIMQKRLTLTGSTMRPLSVAEKGEIAGELFTRVWPLLESGEVKIIIDKVYRLEQAVEAHRYLEAGEHIGKVIFQVQ